MNATRPSVALIMASLTCGAVSAAEAPPGASSCTGCHAAGADAGRPLAGRPQAEIAARMMAFKAGREPATIMDRIAKGFTEDEIRTIAAWFAAQK